MNKLEGVSKELFDALNYILQDKELALGYLGIFEQIILKSEINAKIDVLKESMKSEYSPSGLIGYYKHELAKIKK